VRGQSQGDRQAQTQAGSAPLRRRATVRLEKGRGVWMHGLKGREEIAGLTGSRAKAMDLAIYPTLALSSKKLSANRGTDGKTDRRTDGRTETPKYVQILL
jgi:hypothetical protein